MAGDLWDERPRGRSLAFDIAVAVVFAAIALASTSMLGAGGAVAAITMSLAVLLRRLAVPAMVLLASVAGVAQLVVGQLAVVVDLGYAWVFFALGAHPLAWVRRAGLGAVLVTVVVAAVAVATGLDNEVAGSSTLFAAVVTGALSLLVAGGGYAGGYVRWQNRARINAQVRTGLAEERTRIAADMHDLVAHTWAVVAAQAAGARYALGGPDGERKAAEALDVIAETARGSISDLRELLADLRYEEPAGPPGEATREALFRRLRASGLDLHAVEHGTPAPTPDTHRLLSESLTNALKHGDLAHRVEVEEDWRAGYRLVVRNRVRTTEVPAAVAVGTGHGLDGMRERAGRYGGELSAGAVDGTWTTTLTLPPVTRP